MKFPAIDLHQDKCAQYGQQQGHPHNEAAAPSHGHQQSPDHDQYRGAEVDQESIDGFFNFIGLVVQAVDCDAGRTELLQLRQPLIDTLADLNHVDLVPEGNPQGDGRLAVHAQQV